MPFRGVVLDLFGTLVDGFSLEQARSNLREIAQVLEVPAEAFERVMSRSYTERATGILGGTADTLAALCRRIGHHPSRSALLTAAGMRLEQFHQVLREPRVEVYSVLCTLRDRGFRIGMISDCSEETPRLWSRLAWVGPIQYPIFSWEAGIRKPAPALYQQVCEGLQLSPSELLYVGDGGSHELSGAEAAGMAARRIARSMPDWEPLLQYDADLRWEGETVTTFAEVVQLLSAPADQPAPALSVSGSGR